MIAQVKDLLLKVSPLCIITNNIPDEKQRKVARLCEI